MLVNKTDIFYSIRSNFAHADLVTSPKMAVGLNEYLDQPACERRLVLVAFFHVID